MSERLDQPPHLRWHGTVACGAQGKATFSLNAVNCLNCLNAVIHLLAERRRAIWHSQGVYVWTTETGRVTLEDARRHSKLVDEILAEHRNRHEGLPKKARTYRRKNSRK